MKQVLFFLAALVLGMSACRKSRQPKSYVLNEKFSLALGETAIVKDTSVYEIVEGEKRYPQYEVTFQRVLKDDRNWGFSCMGFCRTCAADVEIWTIGAAGLREVAEFSYQQCRNDDMDDYHDTYSEMLSDSQKALNDRLYLSMHRVRPAIYGDSNSNREKFYDKEKGKYSVELSLKLK